jgi:hypothetical protein
MSPLLEGLTLLIQALEELEIPYLIGGSMASSIYGQPRLTNDVDLVVVLPPERAGELSRRLRKDFYADELEIAEAMQRGRSVNVVHMATAYKFDLFPLEKTPFGQMQMQRRRREELKPFAPGMVAPVAAPEDILLQKLVWFRTSGRISELQWKDVRGVLMVQGPELNYDYCDTWAEKLGVLDLWKQLLAETEIPPPERPGDVPF